MKTLLHKLAVAAAVGAPLALALLETGPRIRL
jgi:hypothetical protein